MFQGFAQGFNRAMFPAAGVALLVAAAGLSPLGVARADHGAGTCVTPDGRNVPCSHRARPRTQPPSRSRPRKSPQQIERDTEREALRLNEQGFRAYRRGDYVAAIRFFKRALEYAPHNPNIRSNLAKARQRARRRTEPPPRPKAKPRPRPKAKPRPRSRVEEARRHRQAEEVRLRLALAKRLLPRNYNIQCVRTAITAGRTEWNANICPKGSKQNGKRSCFVCGKALLESLEVNLDKAKYKSEFVQGALQKFLFCLSERDGLCNRTKIPGVATCGYRIFASIYGVGANGWPSGKGRCATK